MFDLNHDFNHLFKSINPGWYAALFVVLSSIVVVCVV